MDRKPNTSDASVVMVIDQLEDRRMMSVTLQELAQSSFGSPSTQPVSYAEQRAAMLARLTRQVTDSTITLTSTDAGGNAVSTATRSIARTPRSLVVGARTLRTVTKAVTPPATARTVNTNAPGNVGPIKQGTGVGGVSAFNVGRFITFVS
jgi:hypothetical protein